MSIDPTPAPAAPDPGLESLRSSRGWPGVLAAWVLTLGWDVFLHGGLLARLYVEPGPFLLGAEQAFRRIPLGYAAFLVLVVALQWLLRRLHVRGARSGLRLGTAVGAVTWGAFAIGLYSISTATPALLAGWWIGQTLELGLAGAVLGAARAGYPLRRLWLWVALAVLACGAGVVLLQSTGLAPSMKVVLVRCPGEAARLHQDYVFASIFTRLGSPAPWW